MRYLIAGVSALILISAATAAWIFFREESPATSIEQLDGPRKSLESRVQAIEHKIALAAKRKAVTEALAMPDAFEVNVAEAMIFNKKRVPLHLMTEHEKKQSVFDAVVKKWGVEPEMLEGKNEIERITLLYSALQKYNVEWEIKEAAKTTAADKP